MSWKHIDIEGAIRRLADRKIEQAMREGKFDPINTLGSNALRTGVAPVPLEQALDEWRRRAAPEGQG